MQEHPRSDEDPRDLKIIRFTGERINEPEAPHAAVYPYRLEVNLRPPEFMQVTFIMRYGGSEELILRGRTREAIDRFLAQQDLRHHPRLRSLRITGPEGVIEETRR